MYRVVRVVALKLDANTESRFLGNFPIYKNVRNSTKKWMQIQVRESFRGIFRFTKKYAVAPKVDANSDYGRF